jgi:hypothetical protein
MSYNYRASNTQKHQYHHESGLKSNNIYIGIALNENSSGTQTVNEFLVHFHKPARKTCLPWNIPYISCLRDKIAGNTGLQLVLLTLSFDDEVDGVYQGLFCFVFVVRCHVSALSIQQAVESKYLTPSTFKTIGFSI